MRSPSPSWGTPSHGHPSALPSIEAWGPAVAMMARGSETAGVVSSPAPPARAPSSSSPAYPTRV